MPGSWLVLGSGRNKNESESEAGGGADKRGKIDLLVGQRAGGLQYGGGKGTWEDQRKRGSRGKRKAVEGALQRLLRERRGSSAQQ